MMEGGQFAGESEHHVPPTFLQKLFICAQKEHKWLYASSQTKFLL